MAFNDWLGTTFTTVTSIPGNPPYPEMEFRQIYQRAISDSLESAWLTENSTGLSSLSRKRWKVSFWCEVSGSRMRKRREGNPISDDEQRKHSEVPNVNREGQVSGIQSAKRNFTTKQNFFMHYYISNALKPGIHSWTTIQNNKKHYSDDPPP